MKVVIYGKKGCKLCEACKEKMHIMQVPYDFVDLMDPVGNWRDTKATDARASFEMMDPDDQLLPIVEVNGEFMFYEKSMKTIKDLLRMKKEAEKKAVVINMPPLQEVRGEVALACWAG